MENWRKGFAKNERIANEIHDKKGYYYNKWRKAMKEAVRRL